MGMTKAVSCCASRSSADFRPVQMALAAADAWSTLCRVQSMTFCQKEFLAVLIKQDKYEGRMSFWSATTGQKHTHGAIWQSDTVFWAPGLLKTASPDVLNIGVCDYKPVEKRKWIDE